MVVGAGEAANAIIKEIVNSNFSTMVIRCIIDDDKGKWGKYIQGIKVAGGRDKIVECADIYNIDEIIVAMPSATRADHDKRYPAGIVKISSSSGSYSVRMR